MSGKYAFTKSLKEVRFLFCQTSEHSGPTRSFLARAYPTMKKNNPYIPIMLREAAGTQPRVYARYGEEPFQPHPIMMRDGAISSDSIHCTDVMAEFGKEKMEPLDGLSDKEIEAKVTGLVKTES